MDIKNEQVKIIYDRWKSIWHNVDKKEMTRLKAFSIIQVIEALVCVYELDEKLDEENIDSLFISWGEGIKPLFPENRGYFFKNIEDER